MGENGIPRMSAVAVSQAVETAYQQSGSTLLELGLGQANEWRTIDQEVMRLFAAHINDLSREAFPWTAVGTADEWGALFNTFKKEASSARGPIELSGTDGVAVPINSVVQVGAIQYRVTGGQSVVGGKVSLDVVALQPGLQGNAVAGTNVNLVSPIVGIDAQGVVGAAGIVGGADEEDFYEFRNRTVNGLRVAPGGGNDDDYVRWALEVPGVTRAWVDPHGNGDGTVVVRFMMDNAYSDGIPQGSDEEAVLAYLRRHFDEGVGRYVGYPVHMDGKVYAWAPIAKPLQFQISGLDPVTDAVKSAIEAQLIDLIRREGKPGASLHPSWCWEAISLATGERRHTLVTPSEPFETARGEIVTYGGVSYATT